MSSDTRTMTLTDFILDRLADLELAAQIALATAPAEPIEGITPAGAVWFTPEQVLADIAAKRAIVELHRYWDGDANDYGQTRQVLERLAAAYDDHPDYDEVWRP